MRHTGGLAVLAASASIAGCVKPIELLWVQPGEGASKCTPAVTEDAIVFGNESGYVHAYAKSGVPRWRFTALRDVISTPAVYKNFVLFGSVSNMFYGVDLAAGREIWRFPAKNRIKGDPTVWEDTVYFGSYDRHVYALDPTSGKLKWMFPALPPPPAPAPDAVKEKGSSREPAPTATPPRPAETVETGDFSYAQPTIVDGVLYLGSLDGYLYALNAKTGEMKWRFKTGAGITSTVLAAGGVLYFGSNDHRLYALDSNTREPRWTFETGDEVNSAPRMSDGVIYVGGVDKRFYAVDPATGQKKWEFQTRGRIVGSAAFYKNLVLFGAGPDDGNIYALNKASGKLFWSYSTDSKVDTDPVVDDSRLYVVAGDGRLFAFQINKTPL